MKTIVKLIAALLVCLCVVTCVKDFRNSLDPVLPPVISPFDTIKISKLVFIDTTVSATDTISYRQYIYDSLKRVTTINIYNYQDSIASTGIVIAYYYTGNNALPYKSAATNFFTQNPYSDTTFYFYDYLSRLMKDSLIIPSGFQVNQYSYSTTLIADARRFVDLTNPPDTVTYTYADTALIASTGNISKTYGTDSNMAPYTNIFMYDSKPNPFYFLNIHATYSPLGIEGFQKNNYTLISKENPLLPGSLASEAYTYIYNSLGLPETALVSFSNAVGAYNKIIFIYKKL